METEKTLNNETLFGAASFQTDQFFFLQNMTKINILSPFRRETTFNVVLGRDEVCSGFIKVSFPVIMWMLFNQSLVNTPLLY